jgi:hypothetical protein
MLDFESLADFKKIFARGEAKKRAAGFPPYVTSVGA